MARPRGVSHTCGPVTLRCHPRLALGLLLALAAAGCTPRIGDGCAASSNCSINGDRLCDSSQPGGACTVLDCQADRCPDNAVCVRFNPIPVRRAVVACMHRCENDGDCRAAEGYRCRSTEELAAEGLASAVVDVARPDARFCVADP